MTSRGYLHTNGTPLSLYCILKLRGKYKGNFLVEISSVILYEKEVEISTLKMLLNFPWISAGKLWGNFRRHDPLKFPKKSVRKSGGRGLVAGCVDAHIWVVNSCPRILSHSYLCDEFSSLFIGRCAAQSWQNLYCLRGDSVRKSYCTMAKLYEIHIWR